MDHQRLSFNGPAIENSKNFQQIHNCTKNIIVDLGQENFCNSSYRNCVNAREVVKINFCSIVCTVYNRSMIALVTYSVEIWEREFFFWVGRGRGGGPWKQQHPIAT